MEMVSQASAVRTHALVLYDDKCPMCTFQMRVLTRLDWFKRLEFVSISDPQVAALVPALKREDLMAAMHVLTPAGKIHRGARAVRYMAARILLLWPLCLLLWIPGMIYLGEFVYRRVANNRYLLSKLFGCKTACAVVPPPKVKAP